MNARLIEKEALALPIDKRARLAQRLLESLDDLSEAEAERLWAQEAMRRAREIDEGKVQLVSSEEFERRIRARLDYSKSKPNRFAAKLKGATAVLLQPDVAKVFQSADAVNDLLRSAIAATRPGGPKRRAAAGANGRKCPAA